jgi:hypothetical protein
MNMNTDYELTPKQKRMIGELVFRGVADMYAHPDRLAENIVVFCNAWDMNSFDVITCINHLALMFEWETISYDVTDDIRCWENEYGEAIYEVR